MTFTYLRKCVQLHAFNCRGGGWYIICAKSVAVTWPCAHCFDKYFSLSRCSSLFAAAISASVLCVCSS